MEDLNAALVILKAEPLYGYNSQVPTLQKYASDFYTSLNLGMDVIFSKIAVQPFKMNLNLFI